MNIHADFIGGNIRVLSIDGDVVHVQNEIRDTTEDWFYWAFCVEGAEGRTLTFQFDKPWVGYYGPAISRDFVNWQWLGSPDESKVSDTFTYTFGEAERRVWFAHNLLYHPAHFAAFCEKHSLQPQELCRSEKGRSVPYLRFGQGEETILLTCRHHACEATGSHVLEGVLEELLREPIPDLQVIAVPFVDYDGVADGDQGKRRAPHDHYVDYPAEGESLYASVRRIRELAAEKPLRYAFDFHSPWHAGKQNDWVFFPQEHWDIVKNMTRLQNLFEKRITPKSLPYSPDGTFMPGREWNILGTPSINTYMHETAGAELSMVLETPYFKCLGVPFTQDAAREMGRCFVRALRDYHNRPVKISFTGDILYNNPTNDWCKTADGYDYLPLFAQMWGRLPDADYLVGTIESPANGMLDSLQKTGFDLVFSSSHEPIELNCTNDCGAEKCKDVFVRQIGGISIGFVNANSPERLQEMIQRTKAQSDFVVVRSPVPNANAQTYLNQLWECGADLIVGKHSQMIQPVISENGRLAVCCLGNLLSAQPEDSKHSCGISPDFSIILNLTLSKKDDGSIGKRLSFRVCQVIHDPEQKKAPYLVDTYDQWRKHPASAYKDTILYYANCFVPSRNYTEPMAEYPIC